MASEPPCSYCGVQCGKDRKRFPMGTSAAGAEVFGHFCSSHRQAYGNALNARVEYFSQNPAKAHTVVAEVKGPKEGVQEATRALSMAMSREQRKKTAEGAPGDGFPVANKRRRLAPAEKRTEAATAAGEAADTQQEAMQYWRRERLRRFLMAGAAVLGEMRRPTELEGALARAVEAEAAARGEAARATREAEVSG
ncbi:hypothetical protein CYMTET_35923, partial [Cymbomonas tetramitiformis]